MRQTRALISLTRFGEPDALVIETLDSLAGQTGAGFAVHLFDQNPSAGLEAAAARLSTPDLPMRYEAVTPEGLCAARNAAIAAAAEAGAPIVLYIDPDALAAPDWAERLTAALEETPDAALVGARILPLWRARPPLLARAGFVKDIYSLLDLGAGRRDYHRVVGAGFGLHRARLGEEAWFDPRLGRRDGRLMSGEESELAARAATAGWRVIYEGGARTQHQIMAERANSAWIFRRFYYAGWTRAGVGGAPSPSKRPKGAELIAAAILAIPYFTGFFVAKYQRARGG